MNKPYVSELDDRGGIRVFMVDGEYIRKNMDKEFTNAGQHWRYPKLIPENEIWLDVESNDDGEIPFYITNMMTQRSAMKDGMSYDKALINADKVERAMRKREQNAVGMSGGGKSGNRGGCKVKELGYCDDNVKVYLVNGKRVRDTEDIDFTEGGHDKVYPYIPKGEVWIDDDVKDSERKYIIAHELEERRCMDRGMSYRGAHKLASKCEYECRHDDKKLKDTLDRYGYRGV